MQHPDLESLLRERGGHAYLITVTAEGGPHAIYVSVLHDQDGFVAAAGEKTAAFAAARPRVSLLYPARDPESYSLIVDGVATVEPGEAAPMVRIRPTRIVLHRSAAGTDPDAVCDSDCVSLPIA